MRLIVDIPDDRLNMLRNEPIAQNFTVYELASYIVDGGVPLPEGEEGHQKDEEEGSER